MSVNYPIMPQYAPSMYSWEKNPRKQAVLKVCAVCGRNMKGRES